MSLIHKLAPTLAQKIAAGEVVTRPESVVKELVENSLDSGAQTVTVIIKQAGRTLIQVVDDGSGMSREDAELSVERHATSKLNEIDDLEKLHTYGFRGEALAAIASVSQFEMRTRLHAEELGTFVKVEGSIKREVRSEACDEGTTIAIRNLFFNVPARRKFLKSEATEFKHIIDTVTRAALSNPGVRFVLVSDHDSVFDLPAFRPLPERIEQIFGSKLRSSLLPVEKITPSFHLHGFISAPGFVKRVRTEQFFFVNDRPIHSSRGLSFAVSNAYEHLVEKGAFPSSFLYIDIDPAKVDVNVHPQKLEIKFEDERAIIDEVRHTLSDVLQRVTQQSAAEGAMAPQMQMPHAINQTEAARLRFPERTSAPLPRAVATLERGASLKPPLAGNGLGTVERLFDKGPQDLFGTQTSRLVPSSETQVSEDGQVAPQPRSSEAERKAITAEALAEKPVLWQMHNKYIFSQIKSGIMIVDQHVAHERILYERILHSLETGSANSQELLFPQSVDLLPREVAMIRELQSALEGIGFHIRFFGGTSIVIDAVPTDVKSGSEATILHELLESYDEYERLGTFSSREALAAGFSCRAAIKSGDKLSQEEMHSLIEQLFQTKMPYVCPHGRPIVIKLALDELDRRFGRTPVPIKAD
ncbi:MAG TPA: DNA mismatch repair endonuclease MutL [Candidatus Kapabacteria bacterium]|nr:DNA mismatch repair endonuclease MutL [Candidatus Kapabacteria bacterium]